MSLKGLYKSEVVCCTPDTSIVEAAKLMKSHHVGDVVVVEEANSRRKPVGILTDRDIVIGGVCEHGTRIANVQVKELMSSDPVTIQEDTSLFEALKEMRSSGVSRVPIVEEDGSLCGILSAGNIFRVLNEEMTELTHLAKNRFDYSERRNVQTSKSEQESRLQ